MPSIIIPDVSPRNTFTAYQGQVLFTYDFPIFAGSDLSVFLTPAGSSPNDAGQKLIYIEQYTVTGVNSEGGGTVVLVTGANANDVITIVRTAPNERPNYYINTAITADALNTDFESQLLFIQQNTLYNEQITPHYNLCAPIAPIIDTTLPLLPPNSTWVKNAGNTAITTALIPANPVQTDGPNVGTLNHITRWLAPEVVQDSSVVLDDAGNFSEVGSILGTTDLSLNAATGHNVIISGFKYPTVDGLNGYALKTDGAGTLSFEPDGGPSSAVSVAQVIDQTSHGFSIGNVVLYNGTSYVLAKADTSSDAEVIGIVSVNINADSFQMTTEGQVTGLSGLTPGATYFLSDVTAGALTTTEPSTVNHISKPLFIAQSTTSGYFHNFRGKVVPAPNIVTGFTWNVITSSTSMIANNGYICNSSSPIVLTLPVNINAGEEFIAINQGTGGFTIAQNAGQNIRISDQLSTTGTGGSISAAAVGASVQIVCCVNNTSLINFGAPNGFITVT